MGLLRLPALRALLLQAGSLVLVVLIARLSWLWLGVKIELLVAVILQGVFSALGARLLKMAVWWWLIQLLLPLALLLTWMLHLPAGVFLLGFILLVLIYWSCFRTQVPYYPSSQFVRQQILQLMPLQVSVRFIDIGSGLGGLPLYLLKNRPKSQCFGIELAPLPWLISYLRATLSHSPVQFLRGDYHELDFSQFDLVFAYLSPAAMSALWRKAQNEMRAGSLLLSYEFIVVEQSPTFIMNDPCGGPALYGWQF
ncbi:MAG: hypothetical protein RL748_1666 [Pseudomonadota bacterium]|jgi:hypothetical protein